MLRDAANFQALSPLSFLGHAASVYPQRLDADQLQPAASLGHKPVRAIFAWPRPWPSAVLTAINSHLDAEAIAFILQHSEAKVLLVDKEFDELVARATSHLPSHPLISAIDDPEYAQGQLIGQFDYEALLAEGDTDYAWQMPSDEWQAISLNYTLHGQP
jgi:fatty-acyl-CoA synthase